MLSKKILAVLLTIVLGFTTVACGSSNVNADSANNSIAQVKNNIPDGQYPVQQATFNDLDGEYRLMLLNTPTGVKPTFATTELRMARLTEEEIKNGQQTYVDINGNDAVMHLTEDFRIEYIHSETETVTNANTGRQETVVIRQQSSFWTPFAGALAGQAIGSMLFTPQYYLPPVYSGGTMRGFGGYGNSYNDAVQSYRSNYNSAPPVEKNRQTLRTSGSVRNTNTSAVRSNNPNNSKATGAGVGSTNLKTNGSSTKVKQPSSNSFGSNNSYRRTTPRRSSGFGSSRRRR
ncbi:MAG: hypothetical protein IGQ45_04640 [Cyanobacterium sp. T60_A2020_053]|nr:hypothetical protein [Cyanobacterium sp. T60_A2020_053]